MEERHEHDQIYDCRCRRHGSVCFASHGAVERWNQQHYGRTERRDQRHGSEDVFGFDITQGGTNLTAEQLTAARNTCNQNVTAEPLKYSAAVKTFCTQIQ